ncbi:MAG: phosphomethylpyrimidine kinase [Methanoregulaceae archaeon]|nr:phosphomethylpyrimidine kinase [Methanoregulaceae archaeon]
MSREERDEVLHKLREAAEELVKSISPALVPSAGMNLAYALPGARNSGDVAAVAGGIVLEEGKPCMSGPAGFGTGDQAEGIVLTVSRFDPEVLSAAVIRFSPEFLESLEGMFLETCSFDRATGPPGIRSMDWGVASCCRTGVPDVIYDLGAPGVEPLIRILDISPGEVANKIIMLSARIE